MYKCFRPSTILSSWNDDDLILNVPKPSLILILNHQFKDLSYVFFFLSRFHSCRTPLNSVIGHSDRSIKYRCLVNGRNQANAQLNQPKFHAIQWHIHHATYLSVISETNIFSFNSPAFLMCVLWVAWNESLSRTLMNTSIGTGKRAFRSIRWIFFFWSFQFIFLQFCWAVWLLLCSFISILILSPTEFGCPRDGNE